MDASDAPVGAASDAPVGAASDAPVGAASDAPVGAAAPTGEVIFTPVIQAEPVPA